MEFPCWTCNNRIIHTTDYSRQEGETVSLQNEQVSDFFSIAYDCTGQKKQNSCFLISMWNTLSNTTHRQKEMQEE